MDQAPAFQWSRAACVRATPYGTYANWLVTTLAAVFGTKALSPLTGTSQGGQPWQETIVTVGFMSVGIAIVIAAVLLLWRFRRGTQKLEVALGDEV